MLSRLRSKIQALTTHEGFRRYATNTSWMMAEQMLRIFAGLMVGIWVARYLGPDQFGLLSYVLAFTSIFGGIAKLGLDGILVREMVNHPENRDTYLGTAFWLKVAGALLAAAMIAMIVPFTSNDITTNLFIFIIAAGLVFQSFEVVEFYFQSKVLAKIVSICKIIQLTLSSIIKVYLVLSQAELIWFVVVTTVDTLSLALSYFIAYKLRIKSNIFRCFDRHTAKSLLKDSWPLILSSLVVMIYMRIDQIMIKEILGDYEVGIYSAATRLSEAFYFLPTILCASLFPAIVKAKSMSTTIYESRIKNLYSTLIWLAIIISIPTIIFSEQIVLLLFGDGFHKSSEILRIHIMALPFVFLLVASGKWLINEGLTSLALLRNSCAVAINILLNYITIPKYGASGAAWATLASFLVSAYVFDIFDRRTRSQFILKTKSFLFIKVNNAKNHAI